MCIQPVAGSKARILHVEYITSNGIRRLIPAQISVDSPDISMSELGTFRSVR